jgi:hypothetical protein
MKTRLAKSIYGVALVSVLILVGAAFLAPTLGVKAQQQDKQEEQEKSEQRARELEGVWRAQVTLRVCQTGAEIRTFQTLATFARGGTMIATVTGASPASVSADYGIWRYTGGHSFSAVSEAFLFNPAGAWIGTQRITRAIELGHHPEVLTINTSVEIFDTNSVLLATGCATAVGQRFE